MYEAKPRKLNFISVSIGKDRDFEINEKMIDFLGKLQNYFCSSLKTILKVVPFPTSDCAIFTSPL